MKEKSGRYSLQNLENRKAREDKIRVLIALGKTQHQVEEELNIPTSSCQRVRRLYSRKMIVELLDKKNSAEIARLAQIPIDIVEQIREEQRAKELDIRIYSALGTPHEQIVKELNIAVSTVSRRKRETKKLYSREMIVDLLRSKEDEEIANLAQVPLEIIEKIRKEQQAEEENLRNLIALGLTTDEIARKWNLSSRILIENRKAKLGKIYTREEIASLLEKQSDEQIARLAQISKEVVTQIRQEEMRTEKEKTMENLTSKDEKEIRNLVALGLNNGEIARRLHYSKVSIRNVKIVLGIYSRVQIANLLEAYEDSEIAQMAEIDVPIVAQVRGEEKRREKKKRDTYKTARDKEYLEQEIRELTAQGVSIEEMTYILSLDGIYIKQFKARLGIYSKIQIVKLLGMKDTIAVANITKVDVDIIAEVREELERQKQAKEGKSKDKMQKQKDKEKRVKSLRIAFANGVANEKMQGQFHFNSCRALYNFKAQNNILSRKQITMLMNDSNSTNEQIAQLAQIPIELVIEIREEKDKQNQALKEECKNSIQQLSKAIKSLNDRKTTKLMQHKIRISKKISDILRKYRFFLTQLDYTFIAYSYLKIGMEEECKGIAEGYLGMQEFSKEEIVRRINKILADEKARREEPIVLISPNEYKGIKEER